MALTSILVPTYINTLGALSNWLAKAQAQLGEADAEALLTARLAPDMFPLATQVRFACVQALEASHRLRGVAFPETIGALLDEGRKAGEMPGSIADARARIDETIRQMKALAPDALDREPSSPVAHELANGMIFDLTAEQYARDWTLAQFYFHVMIAYAIMRKEGIDLGKVDYIPHMLPYLRSNP